MTTEDGQWRLYKDSDPYYALLGEVQQFRVYDVDSNEVKVDVLEGYCKRFFVEGLAKKPKDWVEIWARMLVPPAIQGPVLEVILRFALHNKPDNLDKILNELMKQFRVKVPQAIQAIKGAFAGCTKCYGIMGRLLMKIFPKSPDYQKGWARVGWGWQLWWQFAEHTLNVMDPRCAFDELALALENIELASQKPIKDQELWQTQNRISKAQKLLCKYGSIEDEKDLDACCDVTFT